MNLRLLVMIMMSSTVFTGVSSAQTVDSGTNETRQKRYLEALTQPPNYSDPSYIGLDFDPTGRIQSNRPADLSSIIVSMQFEDLHRDPDIQKALIAIREYHPITNARWHASKAAPPMESTKRTYLVGHTEFKDINKTRNYCTAESVDAKPVATVSDDLVDDLTPIYDYGIEGQDFNDEAVKGVDIFAKEVLGGWLTGYGKVPSLGLHYIPRDRTQNTQFLLAGKIHAIIQKDNSDSFLILSNIEIRPFGESSTLCPSSLKVSEVKETSEGEFEVKLLRRLPGRVKNVTQLENGELFITFGTKCFTRGIEGGSIQDKYFFNPPIGLTASGQIYDVCERGSSTKRW